MIVCQKDACGVFSRWLFTLHPPEGAGVQQQLAPHSVHPSGNKSGVRAGSLLPQHSRKVQNSMIIIILVNLLYSHPFIPSSMSNLHSVHTQLKKKGKA